MAKSRFLKAKCKKTGQYYALEIKKFGSEWRVVNMVSLSAEQAALTVSLVRQSSFETNTNLLACVECGSRKVGGCKCPAKKRRCSAKDEYNFDCIYCTELEVDYSRPTARDIARFGGKSFTSPQGDEIDVVTFSNVEWKKFDNVYPHDVAPAHYNEPRVHVHASGENIEFHGYNVSRMDEGVYYTINANDDFEIECDVDTSTIQPHPGGCLYINFGSITAEITQNGGSFYLNGAAIAQVGSRFHMVLSLVDGVYSVVVDKVTKGAASQSGTSEVKVTFGFKHDSHYCNILSHAYVRGIKMIHSRVNGDRQ